ARVDLSESDIEMVALEFLQIIAANFCCLGGFSNGDAFLLARFLEPFADGLHGLELEKAENEVTTKHTKPTRCSGRSPRFRVFRAVRGEQTQSVSGSIRISRGLEPFSGPTMP